MSSKDDQSDSAQLVNSVDSFVCQSTIIPADGRGFRMAISSQSISLADAFVGTAPVRRRPAAPWPLACDVASDVVGFRFSSRGDGGLGPGLGGR